jgi:phenylpropionate dioxygenase-like ring-hydroxylating dioxygenase large terminal subunit
MLDVRSSSANLHYWWPVAQRHNFSQTGLQKARIGNLELVVFQKETGEFSVFEDACPHRRVPLSQFGQKQKQELICSYHGWRFDGNDGTCLAVTGLSDCKDAFCLQSYPVREYGEWVWVFPGDPELAEQVALPEIEALQPTDDFLSISLERMAQCHFSYLVENALDLFHNELHRNVQPWFDSQLVEYKGNQKMVKAVYEVSVPNFLNLFTKDSARTRTHLLYDYPYFYQESEDGKVAILSVWVPVGEQETRIFSTFYFRTRWNFPGLKQLLRFNLKRGFQKILAQDIQAVEQEQRAYNYHNRELTREPNPVLHAARRVISSQAQPTPPS